MLRDEPAVPKDKDFPPTPGVPATGQTEDQLREIQRARRARVAKVLVGLAILVVLIIFIIANSQHVPVDFVFFTRHPRLIWVMFACITDTARSRRRTGSVSWSTPPAASGPGLPVSAGPTPPAA